MKSEFGDTPQINSVSPLIGQELAKNAMTALILASIGIIIYVSLRFEWRMGLSAVLALLHDVFIIVAVFSLFRLEVDLTFIAAVLTIVGYSMIQLLLSTVFEKTCIRLRWLRHLSKLTILLIDQLDKQ